MASWIKLIFDTVAVLGMLDLGN